MAAGGNHLVEPMVPDVELRMAWVGIVFARQALDAGQIIIEGDSAMVVAFL